MLSLSLITLIRSASLSNAPNTEPLFLRFFKRRLFKLQPTEFYPNRSNCSECNRVTLVSKSYRVFRSFSPLHIWFSSESLISQRWRNGTRKNIFALTFRLEPLFSRTPNESGLASRLIIDWFAKQFTFMLTKISDMTNERIEISQRCIETSWYIKKKIFSTYMRVYKEVNVPFIYPDTSNRLKAELILPT